MPKRKRKEKKLDLLDFNSDEEVTEDDIEEPSKKKKKFSVNGVEEPEERIPKIFVSLNGQKNDDQKKVKEDNVFISIPGVVLGYGKPGSGKTHMVRYLMQTAINYFRWGLIICPSPTALEEYEWAPKDFVKTEYRREMIKAFMDTQEKNRRPPAFLILDDCVGAAEFNDPYIYQLCTKIRKYNVFLIMIVQGIARIIPPVIRACLTHEFFFRANEDTIVSTIHKSFLGTYFLKPKDLKAYMSQMPLKDHTCIWNDEGFSGNEPYCRRVSAPPEIPKFVMKWEAQPPKKEDQEGSEEEAFPEPMKHLITPDSLYHHVKQGSIPKPYPSKHNERLEVFEPFRHTAEKAITPNARAPQQQPVAATPKTSEIVARIRKEPVMPVPVYKTNLAKTRDKSEYTSSFGAGSKKYK